MDPQTAYRQLNELIWLGRLPVATIVIVDNDTIPSCHGVTLDEDMFAKPVIILNSKSHLGHTLVHEMIHIAEPKLNHGHLFETLVNRYWLFAKKNIKGIRTIRGKKNVG